ncbi:hypothetical protein FJW07_14190 [Mesorhizobium sp. B3-1-9]|uniref:hypothetical protein n=1 Tax=Mesorhizobium sp. B3-1-9 TaxID=2589892 RepID=UPI001126D989|nr:hypothetical protein [Mesorhizobium sp. B3-1-9]TPI39322.1 hypothetical protein FJW07_14190 [Mesorhizobium sp. B3-1-9]
MTRMRAKMRITAVTPYPAEGDASQETLQFYAVAKDGPYPSDGSDEDNSYAKFSPSGELKLTVANPALIGKYKQGDTFYVDFTPIG